MGAKKKAAKEPGKKKSTESEAQARADAVDDIHDEDYKKTLRIESRELEKQIKKEEVKLMLWVWFFDNMFLNCIFVNILSFF